MTDKDKNPTADPDTLGGVHRSNCFLAAGFLRGMASAPNRPLDDFERKILMDASAAFMAAILERWPQNNA